MLSHDATNLASINTPHSIVWMSPWLCSMECHGAETAANVQGKRKSVVVYS